MTETLNELTDVRVGDMYLPFVPNNSIVRKMIIHIKRGNKLPPFQYDGDWKEHCITNSEGRTLLGSGYRVTEGKNRVAAYKIAFGDSYITPAICAPKRKKKEQQNNCCEVANIL